MRAFVCSCTIFIAHGDSVAVNSTKYLECASKLNLQNGENMKKIEEYGEDTGQMAEFDGIANSIKFEKPLCLCAHWGEFGSSSDGNDMKNRYDKVFRTVEFLAQNFSVTVEMWC